MTDLHQPFLSSAFLRTAWAREYERFLEDGTEEALKLRLTAWSRRRDLRETSAEQAFVQQFFHETWGYRATGTGGANESTAFTALPRYRLPGAGAGGGEGEADLALGWFDRQGVAPVPQVLCEFKDIRSKLDAPQRRRSNNRSPVKQCLDYLASARRGLYGNEPVLPTWGIVSDMNEFRLYWFDRAPHQYLRFVIQPDDPLFTRGLLAEGDEGRLERFLFWKVFHADTLLSEGGKGPLERLIARQWVREREIENEFYREYRALRDRLYQLLAECNPGFPGTRGQLIRLAQKILDRCIFVFYAEDMGDLLQFPHQLLRDILASVSSNQYYDPDGGEAWALLLRLFRAMNVGGLFPPSHRIQCFNGGLFQDDPQLEALAIPNRFFCDRGQGQNEASLASNRRTLLYLAASYNYAARGDAQRSLGLYTLGRIFEQSITELEILEAEAEGRVSLNKISKRKRDGVYYTPEHIVQKLVHETLGLRIAELKAEHGWTDEGAPSREAADAYWEALERIKVVDPACGSGAFLITALQLLLTEYQIAQDQRRRFRRRLPSTEDARLVRDILARNLYGVDINPASVEIARLALWLHTARPGEPLTALDAHIRDGNSLIDDTFYIRNDLEEYAAEERERINAFDWNRAFPEVFEMGGFDAVVSNPPYVKLQNFRKVHADMAEYLREGRQGLTYYESTQTGNFDLYLPFIEKGLRLLNPRGRMGYIAPSLWTKNDYGLALRRLLHRGRNLERWVNFGSHQIFEEATIYTALQFYTAAPNDAVRVSPAPEGELAAIGWAEADNAVPYESLRPDEPWLLLPRPERALIERLAASCRRLDDPAVTSSIFQGLITSADSIYHLSRISPGRYLCKPSGRGSAPYEVELEDALMKPLVSGTEAKRYLRPRTDTFLLFPYEYVEGGARLIDSNRMSRDFPNAWRYLGQHEADLRAREGGAFDDERWYRFGRHQNLDKQEIPCLIVAQTVPHLRVCFDSGGEFYLNNVRVNGIIPAREDEGWFLLGVLNGPVCDFVFRRIAAPKGGGYFEANKQFIAPLPIPRCDARAKRQIAALAESLQRGHSELRDQQLAMAQRLASLRVRSRPETWIFADLGCVEDWDEAAPRSLTPRDRETWVREQRALALEERHRAIGRMLRPEVRLSARYEAGEVRLLIGEVVALRLFLDESEGPFVAAQWQTILDGLKVGEETSGKSLIDALRRIATTDNAALREQVVRLHGQIGLLRGELWAREQQLNELLYTAYGLSAEERSLIERR